MSPLVDVTNTVAPDIPVDIQVSVNKSSSMHELEPKNVKDLISIPSNDFTHQESTATKDTPVLKCNKPKVSHTKRKKRNSRISRIKEEKSSGLQPIQKPELTQRVPPLPSNELSQAFAALELSKEKIDLSNLSSRIGCNLHKGGKSLEDVCKCRLTGSSNTVGPPANSFASTHQCVACSIEFSSLENLACHLVKHIYEGLHAASWLSNAMSILIPSPVSDPSTSGAASSETVETQSESVVETKLITDTSDVEKYQPNT